MIGSGLSDAAYVSFGDRKVDIVTATESEIKVLSPYGEAGETVPVTVRTTAGESARGEAPGFAYDSKGVIKHAQ